VTTLLFYFIVHIHYTYINIDFWVIVLIMGILFICKEIFYPESEDLNQKR
ncbi:SepA family multidrug efflux transporter, partial [Staphylococcus succinus]